MRFPLFLTSLVFSFCVNAAPPESGDNGNYSAEFRKNFSLGIRALNDGENTVAADHFMKAALQAEPFSYESTEAFCWGVNSVDSNFSDRKSRAMLADALVQTYLKTDGSIPSVCVAAYGNMKLNVIDFRNAFSQRNEYKTYSKDDSTIKAAEMIDNTFSNFLKRLRANPAVSPNAYRALRVK